MSNHRINQRITRSGKFYQISWKAQLTYLLGFAFLDDYGVWTADPHEVWRELFVDHSGIKEKDMIDILDELAKVNLTKLYAIKGKLYQQYENFNTFQSFGQGYNKKSSYPTFEECDVDVEHNESNSCNWVYSGVKGCLRVYLVYLGVLPTSNSNSPSNTNSNSPKITNTNSLEELNDEEKNILECFINLSYRIKKDDLVGWQKWLSEIKKDNPNKDLLANAKKWRDYFEVKPPKNHKNSFRNWVSKDYADKKSTGGRDSLEFYEKQTKEHLSKYPPKK